MPPGQRPFTPIAEDAKKRLANAITYKFGGPGIGSFIGDAAKKLGGIAISPLATAADIVAAPIEKVTGTTLVDPKSVGSFNLLSEAWRGAQQASNRAAGDIAAIPFVGKPSASPTAADIRRYGVLEGVGRAAVDYGNLAAMVYPVARAGAISRTARAAEAAATNPYVYGVHVSPVGDLAEIQARQAMQAQTMAGDAMSGSSYMWDARSPQTMGAIFDNPQLNPRVKTDLMMSAEELASLPQPNIYITRAPASSVVQDANVPMSPALRVAGGQEVLAQVPFDRSALQQALEQYIGNPRSATADVLEQRYRGLNPVVKRDIVNRPAQLAEESLRATIANGPNPYMQKNYPGLFTLDPNAPLAELLANPDARRLYEATVQSRSRR